MLRAKKDNGMFSASNMKCRFVSDDLVRVTFGPFEGVPGCVARIARQYRVVAYIKGLYSCITTAYIPPYYLERIKK